MSFAEREESRTQGEPINLYYFRYGEPDTAFFAYTDAEQAVTYDGVTYAPIPIDRDRITSSGTLDKAALIIRLPYNAPLATLYRHSIPSDVTTVIVRQGHTAESEFLVAWSGRVISISVDVTSHQAQLTCDPISTSFRRPMLRRHYQLGCPHVLFGPQCKANKTLASIERYPTAVDGTTLHFAGSWETSGRKPKYVGGTVRWTLEDGRVEIREILRVGDDGETISMSSIGGDMVPGQPVTLTLGCNHQMNDCADVHANIQNFGGQPWIPTVNPIGIRNNYY